MHPIILEDLSRIAAAPLAWQRFNGKRVLVTGAGGLIGSYIVWALLALNGSILDQPVTVYASGRDLEKLRRKLNPDGRWKHLELVSLDLSATTPFSLRPDFIIHAASAARTALHRNDPLGTIEPNIFGTEALLRTALAAGSEGFVFLSSGSVYGHFDVPTGTRIPENTPGCFDHLNTAMSYGESKRMGELLCLSWTVQRGVPTRIVRLGHTYGPGLEAGDDRVFADFVFKIVRGKNLVLHSRGSAVRPFCYITDAIIGIFTILLRGGDGEAYHLINERAECSMLELARELCVEFAERGLRVEVPNGEAAAPPAGLSVDMAKLTALGWQPQVSLREGFRRTVTAMESGTRKNDQ